VGTIPVRAACRDGGGHAGSGATRRQITLSISPRLLERVDEVARRKEVSRATLLTFWIGDALGREAA
jgi:hypothetical protein